PPGGHGSVPHAPGSATALVALPGVHVDQPRQRTPTDDEQVQPRSPRSGDGGGGQPGGDATGGGRGDEGGIPGAGPAQPPGQPGHTGAGCGDPSRGESGGESGVAPGQVCGPSGGDQSQGGGPRPQVGPNPGAAAAFHLVGRPGDDLALHDGFLSGDRVSVRGWGRDGRAPGEATQGQDCRLICFPLGRRVPMWSPKWTFRDDQVFDAEIPTSRAASADRRRCLATWRARRAITRPLSSSPSGGTARRRCSRSSLANSSSTARTLQALRSLTM